jgi:hypothetical protein
MFIFKKHLDRRTFLQGMGATVALPLLDAMMPAFATAATRAVPRLAFVYFPHGAVMDRWTPAGDGPDATFGEILEPLTPFRDRVTIVSGIENTHAYGPVHAITPGTWLSGLSPRMNGMPDERSSRAGAASDWTTADQVAANDLGGETRLPSIEAATEEPREIGTGPWEGSYGSSFARTISFRAAAPRPMSASPRELFDRLFVRGAAADVQSAIDAPSASILDRVAAQAADLSRRLGVRDRATVREYLDGIRKLERRVDRAEALMFAAPQSALAEEAFTERLSLMFDLIALAFRADITRVASCMMAAETSTMTYSHIGVPDPFHSLSHHQNDPARMDALVRIQRYHTAAFAGFVRTLAELPDGDASLLDRSLILYGSNMSDSYRHDHYPLPLAVVGGGCGALCGGGHVRCEERTPLSNLLLTLIRRAGAPAASLGDSTGECPGI